MKKATLKWLIGLVCIGLAFSAGATTWTYTGWTTKTDGYTGGTITDGQWTLSVSTFETDIASIGLTKVSGWKTPSEASLSGILDLRSPSVVVGEKTIELKTIRFAGSAFASWNQSSTHTISAFYGDLAKSFGEQMFYTSTALKEVYLAGTIDTLQKDTFRSTTGGTITNVVFDLPNLTSIYSDAANHAFYGQKKIRRVELVTPFTDMGLVTNIVKNADNGSINALRIYVSKKMWIPSEKETYSETNPTGIFSDITAEEKATLDAEIQKNVMGVLVMGGTRKGIFVHKTSKYDKPTGFAISVR